MACKGVEGGPGYLCRMGDMSPTIYVKRKEHKTWEAQTGRQVHVIKRLMTTTSLRSLTTHLSRRICFNSSSFISQVRHGASPDGLEVRARGLTLV